MVLHAAPAVNLYASYGKGFETPTLNDLAYRSVNGSLPGLNTALKAARSDNYEVGVKAGKGAIRAELAGFYIETRDELAVLQNFNGRAVEQNIGKTARHGAEFAVDADWIDGFSARVAYTYHPRGRGTGVPNVRRHALSAGHGRASGSYLPAVPRNALYLGLTWSYRARPDSPRRSRSKAGQASSPMIAIPHLRTATGRPIGGRDSRSARPAGNSASICDLITSPTAPMSDL